MFCFIHNPKIFILLSQRWKQNQKIHISKACISRFLRFFRKINYTNWLTEYQIMNWRFIDSALALFLPNTIYPQGVLQKLQQLLQLLMFKTAKKCIKRYFWSFLNTLVQNFSFACCAGRKICCFCDW